MPDNAQELLDKTLTGDEDALTELLQREAPALRRSIEINPKWQPMVEVDDVMQVTFMEAFLRVGQFAGSSIGSFQMWLRRIAQNNLRAAIRGLKSAKRPPVHLRNSLGPPAAGSHALLLQDICITTTTPSRRAASREVNGLIETSMAQLPPDYSAVLRAYYFEGQVGEALGDHIGRSRGAACMLLARARDRLGELLGSSSLFFTDSP